MHGVLIHCPLDLLLMSPLGMLYVQGHTLARDDVIHTRRLGAAWPTTAWPYWHGTFTVRASAGVHAQPKGSDGVPDVTFSPDGLNVEVCLHTYTYDTKRASRLLIHEDYSCW